MCHVARRGVVLFLASVVGAPAALAGEIAVPADFPSIQTAIDAAVDGDVVVVAPGTYVENLDFRGKAIAVLSRDGAAVTTIDGAGKGSVIAFQNGEGRGSVIAGFTLVGGAAKHGGGILCSSSSPTIRANVITGNSASVGGAGIWCDHGDPRIARNVIANNRSAGDGGGITLRSSNALVLDNMLFGNDAATGQGGGLVADAGAPTIVNDTFAGNHSSLAGGGLCFVSSANATVVNCILWNDLPDEIRVDSSSAAAVTWCDVQGGFGGTGNLDTDPLFVDAAAGDLHLTAASPCREAGSNAAPNLRSPDFDGDPRVVDAIVEIGADEFFPVPRVDSVTPDRARYDRPPTLLVRGRNFSYGSPVGVRVGPDAATNVVVLDDASLQCDAPAGAPGPADVVVANAYGESAPAAGFTYTPATLVTGDFTPGGHVVVRFLFDPQDGILAIAGAGPAVDFPTPPFDGSLCIVPFLALTVIPPDVWPFDSLQMDGDLPVDPTLIGVEVLLQGLIGPSFGRPKDASWTNCAAFTIE